MENIHFSVVLTKNKLPNLEPPGLMVEMLQSEILLEGMSESPVCAEHQAPCACICVCVCVCNMHTPLLLKKTLLHRMDGCCQTEEEEID